MADIILFTVIGLFAVLSFKKGLVHSVVGMISFIASAVLAWFLYPVVSDALASFGAELSLAEKIRESLNMYVGGEELLLLPQGIQSAIETEKAGAIDSAAQGIAKSLLNVITFAAVLVISRIVIWITANGLNLVAGIPGISFINRIAGMLFGAIQGIAVMYIALAIVYAASPIEGVYEINRMMEQSSVAKIMYENNPIVDFAMTVGQVK